MERLDDVARARLPMFVFFSFAAMVDCSCGLVESALWGHHLPAARPRRGTSADSASAWQS